MTTPHYYGLNALTAEFFNGKFHVLGFPCNNFNLQEPGSNASEILGGLAWVRPGNGFVPNFRMFKKIDVNGKEEHPLYTYLKSMCGPTSDQFENDLYYDPKRVSDVRWNFEIFLISKLGYPVYRYSPDYDVMSIAPDIQALIGGTDRTISREEVVKEPKEVHVEVNEKEEVETNNEKIQY